jgi:NAD(P)-dependent dehydrogenase (short-subunit alcohol dehydrogenase family)
MKYAMRSVLVLFALASAQTASAQTADELIEKSIAAMGGRAAFEKVKTRVMTGTITINTPGGDLPGTGYLGFGVACAAIEGFSRLLACELAPSGIRVICLRPHAVPEALSFGSHAAAVFKPAADKAGITVKEMFEAPAGTLLKRYPTLDEVAATAAFMASDKAGAMTGTIANLTCGALLD